MDGGGDNRRKNEKIKKINEEEREREERGGKEKREKQAETHQLLLLPSVLLADARSVRLQTSSRLKCTNLDCLCHCPPGLLPLPRLYLLIDCRTLTWTDAHRLSTRSHCCCRMPRSAAIWSFTLGILSLSTNMSAPSAVPLSSPSAAERSLPSWHLLPVCSEWLPSICAMEAASYPADEVRQICARTVRPRVPSGDIERQR